MKKLLVIICMLASTSLFSLEYETLVGSCNFVKFEKSVNDSGRVIKQIRPIPENNFLYIVRVGER